MRRYKQAGTVLALCAVLTLGTSSHVFAQEEAAESTQQPQQEATTETQKENGQPAQTHQEQQKVPETDKQEETLKKTEKTKKTRLKKKPMHKKKNMQKQEKKKKKKKAEEKIIPRIYQDMSIEMKAKKEMLHGFVYFNQADDAWNHNGYQIHGSGCGPTAMAVCITSLTGKWVTPVDTAQWAYQHGYYSVAGASHEMVPALAEEYGLFCKGLGTDVSAIRKALRAGHPVTALMGPGYFTKKGHFIVLVGIDEKDQVTVADVGSRSRSHYTYALKDVVEQAKSASAGGPFWEIYKDKKNLKKKISKKKSKEETDAYKDMKEVLQKNYRLIIPMKKGTIVPKDQLVTVGTLDINDMVTIIDSRNMVKTDVALETVAKELNHAALKASFKETVTIEPNRMNFQK